MRKVIMLPTMLKTKKALCLVKHIKNKLFAKNEHRNLIRNIDCIRECSQIFLDLEPLPKCVISNYFIAIYNGYAQYHYKYSDEIVAVYPQSPTDNSVQYKIDNPDIFEILLHIMQNRETIFSTIEYFTKLFIHTDYYNNIQLAFTFLLCNRRTKTFLKEIANIIAQKILFFLFLIKKKKIKK
jgi:hypothetical protein